MKKRIDRALAALLALVMAMTLAPAAGALDIVKCAACGSVNGSNTVIQEATCGEKGLYAYVCPNVNCRLYNSSQLITGEYNSSHHDMVYTPNSDGVTHSGVCKYHSSVVEGAEKHTYVNNGACQKCGAYNYSQVGMSLPERRTVPISLGDTAAKLSAGDIKLTLGSADITSEYTVNCLWFYQGVQVASGSEYPLPASVYNKEGVYYYDLVVSAVPKGTLHRQTVTETCNITVQVEELVTAGAVVTTLDAALRLGDGDGWSAEPISSQIYAQVLAVCGREAVPSHIRFNELPSGDVGKLSVTSTSANYYFRGTESLLDNVTFQPGKTAGEFMASFTAFDTAGKSYAGVLTITVQQYAGDMDVVYATPRNTTLLLETADFQDFWERVSPGGTLDYITFDKLPTSVEGAMYAGYTSSVVPGVQLWLNDMLYVQPGRGQYGISSTAFVPGVTQNSYVTLDFTAYGTRGDRVVSRQGVMYIFLTDSGKSADVAVSAAAGGTALTADAFQKAYRTATGDTGTAGFYIQLMEVPASGSLYAGRSAGKQGTRLTAAALRGRSFACGGAQGESIASLTYVPGAAARETVRYVASSIQGAPLYAGTITFTSAGGTAVQPLVVRYSAPAAGVSFKASDFENLPGASGVKLNLVSFTPPAATLGTLYYGRTATTAGTAITSAGSWFNVSSVTTAGAYAMNNVSFVPAAGSSGVVSIPFTALASNGSQYTGTVQVTILSSAQKPGTTTPGKPGKTFPDVPKTEWYYPYVTDLTTSGVLGGYEDGTFRPSEGVSLGQALKMIMIAAGYEDLSGKGSDWAKPFLDRAKADNLLPAGTVENLNRLVDRYTIAEIAAKAMGLPPAAVTVSPFTDMAASHKASPYVAALYNIGVVEGSEKDGGMIFQGSLGIRRKEIAAIIWRMQNYVQTGNVKGTTA